MKPGPATTQTTPGEGITSMIDQDTARRQRAKPVFVSLYEPAGRRTWWWYSYRCPLCATYQLGRARQLDQVTGRRKGGCGHVIEVAIARTYRNPGAS